MSSLATHDIFENMLAVMITSMMISILMILMMILMMLFVVCSLPRWREWLDEGVVHRHARDVLQLLPCTTSEEVKIAGLIRAYAVAALWFNAIFKRECVVGFMVFPLYEIC